MERDILKSAGLFRQAPGVTFAWINAEKAESPITKLCQVLKVSPSGFYAARVRPESSHAQTDRRLRVLVRVSFDESRPGYLKTLKLNRICFFTSSACQSMKRNPPVMMSVTTAVMRLFQLSAPWRISLTLRAA